jgi:hypothetical protein
MPDSGKLTADATGICRARSKLGNPRKPESYFICTNDAGHDGGADPRHTACDGCGHVLARWRSETSPVEVWGPWGVRWA